MNRQEIIEALQEKGIDAESITVEKNGVSLDGIRLNGGNVCPVVYTDDIIKEAEAHSLSLDAVVDRIIAIAENNKPAIDVNAISRPDFIRDKIRIGMQKATSEDIVKRACPLDDNMEIYLYLQISEEATAKIKPGMIDAAGLDLDALWRRAELNTYAETDIFGFNELLGMPGDDFMWVISNKARTKGAAAILDKAALERFAASHGVNKVYALPSSIHEWIILPYNPDFNIDMLSSMVKEVNAATVDPVDQLGSKAYTLTV